MYGMKCRGSGWIGGGYRKDLEGETFKITCSYCWRQIDVVPIAPEPRTDLRKDGSVVMVVRKQMVDHEFGSACAMRWRRDGNSWLFLTAIILTVISLIHLVLSAF